MVRELLEFSQMWQRPRWSRERLVAYRDRQLRTIVAHAYNNVPYYRRLFDCAGVKPVDIRCAADLAALPTTSKRDVQELPIADRLARGVPQRALITRLTGGSLAVGDEASCFAN